MARDSIQKLSSFKYILSISINIVEVFDVSNKKPKIKLLTWKHGLVIGTGILVGIAFGILRVYLTKGYLEISDITQLILPFAILIVLIVIFLYWANRPGREK